MKLRSWANLLLALAMILGLLGCGETVHQGVAYYSPNWMPDGRIICYKEVSKWSNALWGTRDLGYKTYMTAMNSDGTNEQDLFEVDQSLAGRGIAEITCSPTGEMIGWVVSGHGLECIKISDYQGNILYTITAPSHEAMQYFDWSPDATKIAYSTGNLYVTNIDGAYNNLITINANAVAWRVGEIIAFVKLAGTDYSKISTIKSDGTNEIVTSLIGGDVQKNESNIYYRGRSDLSDERINAVRCVRTNGTNDELKIINYYRSTLKLSFDNTKIVGGDLETGGGNWIRGIWVRNLSGTGEAKLR